MGEVETQAKTIEKQDIAIRDTRKLSLILHVYFESNINPSAQHILRTKFRSNALSHDQIFQTHKSGKWVHTHEYNDKAKKATSDYEICEEELSASVSTYEDKHAVENMINRILNVGKQKIMSYLLYNDLEDLMVHIYLYGINIGDVVSHLFSTFGDTQQEQRPQQIEKLLYNSGIKNEKISYCGVDYIGFFDQVSEVSIPDNSTNNFKNPFYSSSPIDKNRPILNDIFDAMELCQYTYNMQSPIEKSIPSVIGDLIKAKEEKEKEEQSLLEYKLKTEKKGWFIVSHKQLTDLNLTNRLVDFTNGFYSQLFVKDDSTRGRIYAYCTCGTNMTSIKDWFDTNISQGLIGLSAQYTKSVQNAQILDKAIGSKAILLFIGHSLGGGLASNNAIVTSKRYAITFNAAGLSPLRLAVTGNATLKKQIIALWNSKTNIEKNRLEAQKRVFAFVIKGEILNASLTKLHQGALGSIIEIDLDSKQVSAFGKHGLTNFMEYAEVKEQINERYI